MSNDGYIAPEKVTRVRVWNEGDEWFVDGSDGDNGYTESCWSYDNKAAALADVADFREKVGIPSDAITVEVTP